MGDLDKVGTELNHPRGKLVVTGVTSDRSGYIGVIQDNEGRNLFPPRTLSESQVAAVNSA